MSGPPEDFEVFFRLEFRAVGTAVLPLATRLKQRRLPNRRSSRQWPGGAASVGTTAPVRGFVE